MTYKHPDKIDVYAVALQSDIGAERFQQVVDSKLETFWIGTVYGGVATKRGHKLKTPEEAWNNASDAAGTARPLPTRPCAPLTKAQADEALPLLGGELQSF